MVSTCESPPFSCTTCIQFSRSLCSWEYIVTLDYEWRVIRGHLPYRRTIWVRDDRRFAFVVLELWTKLLDPKVYSLTRVAALVGVITCLVSMDVTTPLNCQVGTVFYVCSSRGSNWLQF